MVEGNLELDKFFVAHHFAAILDVDFEKAFHESGSECAILDSLEVLNCQVVFLIRIVDLEEAILLVRLLRRKP